MGHGTIGAHYRFREEKRHQITSPYRFYHRLDRAIKLPRWGINIVVPLTIAQANYKYAVVAVEYFTKWIEAKPLVNIAAAGLRRFFWQNIICCSGVPRKITVDNARQFDCHIFKVFCHQVGVEAAFTLVYPPQSNGQWKKQTH
jgi:hypothetical protein